MDAKAVSLLFNEQGQGMTEYGLLIGTIAIGVVAALLALKVQVLVLVNDRVTEIIDGLG